MTSNTCRKRQSGSLLDCWRVYQTVSCLYLFAASSACIVVPMMCPTINSYKRLIGGEVS